LNNQDPTIMSATRHLQILALLLLLGGGAALQLRNMLVPATFGEIGTYRAAALGTNAAHPLTFPSDARCLKCHEDVQEERVESLHTAVRCVHCHGFGAEHITQATAAEVDSSVTIASAQDWDHHFPTKVDLFITYDRATCLACHQATVGMPESFLQINVAEHLEDQGAEDVEDVNVCFECHTGHSPGL